MTKELEALERIGNNLEHHYPENIKDFKILKQALQRLEEIDNAKPSEALQCLKEMWELSCDGREPEYSLYDTIKQALLKAQEQEKVLEIIFKKKVDIVMLKRCKTVEEYNFCINFSKDDLPISYEQPLTQEEFDLLKRWTNDFSSNT